MRSDFGVVIFGRGSGAMATSFALSFFDGLGCFAFPFRVSGNPCDLKNSEIGSCFPANSAPGTLTGMLSNFAVADIGREVGRAGIHFFRVVLGVVGGSSAETSMYASPSSST